MYQLKAITLFHLITGDHKVSYTNKQNLSNFVFSSGNDAIILQEALRDGLDDFVVLADQGEGVVGNLPPTFFLIDLNFCELDQFGFKSRHFLQGVAVQAALFLVEGPEEAVRVSKAIFVGQDEVGLAFGGQATELAAH